MSIDGTLKSFVARQETQRELPAPVFRNEEDACWVVSTREDVSSVLMDAHAFRNLFDVRPEYRPEVLDVLLSFMPIPPSLGSTDPPEHLRKRRLMSKVFSRERIEGLRPSVMALADDIVGGIKPQGRADLVEAMSNTLPLRVFGLLMTIDESDLLRLAKWRQDWIMLGAYPAELEVEVEAARGLVEMQRFFFELVEARRANPTDDMLSAMIGACLDHDGDGLTMPELLAEIMGLAEAGVESVSATISNSVLYLINDRPQWDAVVAEPALIPAAVEETIRLDPGVRGVMRQATRDVEVGGVMIPEGDLLVVKVGTANRDEQTCPHATRFDSSRSPCSHLSFGKGEHFCIGADLARIEGKAALTALTRELPSLRLDEDREIESWGNATFRMPQSIWVQWDER